MSDNIKILRIGAKFNPSSISIEYNDGSSYLKYRSFDIALANFSIADGIVQTMEKKFSNYFNPQTIPHEKLLKFVKSVIAQAPNINLAAADLETREKYKEQMNVEFEKNQIKPGDPDYQYDIVEDFGEPEEDCDWDD